MMPRLCVASDCSNKDKSDVSYFRFPRNDQLAEQWAANIGRSYFKRFRNSRLCSDHFNEEDFTYSQKRDGRKFRILRKGAVPKRSFTGIYSYQPPECHQVVPVTKIKVENEDEERTIRSCGTQTDTVKREVKPACTQTATMQRTFCTQTPDNTENLRYASTQTLNLARDVSINVKPTTYVKKIQCNMDKVVSSKVVQLSSDRCEERVQYNVLNGRAYSTRMKPGLQMDAKTIQKVGGNIWEQTDTTEKWSKESHESDESVGSEESIPKNEPSFAKNTKSNAARKNGKRRRRRPLYGQLVPLKERQRARMKRKKENTKEVNLLQKSESSASLVESPLEPVVKIEILEPEETNEG